MYWNRDLRRTRGGYWRCAVAKRQQERDWYDRDPVHRITKRLADDARARRSRLAKRKLKLLEED